MKSNSPALKRQGTPRVWPVLLMILPVLCGRGQVENAAAPESPSGPAMAAWREAKFGLFIHWGLYSKLAGSYEGREIDNTWGFKRQDTDWKSASDLLRKLLDICHKGGNFLLNAGPTAEGEIPEASVDRLREKRHHRRFRAAIVSAGIR